MDFVLAVMPVAGYRHCRAGDGIAGFTQRGYAGHMPRTLGYHYVKSAYGLWLPGDVRGSWSEAWDEQIGYLDPIRCTMVTTRACAWRGNA